MTAEIQFFMHFLIPLFVFLVIFIVYTFIKQAWFADRSQSKKIDQGQSKTRTKTIQPLKKQHKIFEDDIDQPDLSIHKIFDINPPQSTKEIESTFINREKELPSDIQRFDNNFHSNKINVIYGLSRAGKSHYMKNLLIQLEKEQLEKKGRHFWMKYINANSKETVRYILHTIFRSLKQGLNLCASSNNIESLPEIKFIQLLLNDMNSLIEEHGQKQIEPIRTKSFFLENRSHLSLLSDLPDFIKASIESLVHQKDFFFYKPSNTEIIELIKFQAKYLVHISQNKYRSVLLAIDDVDLLYLTEKNRSEVNSLYQYLSELSVSNSINILITTRQDFAPDRGKEFEYFREILPLTKTDCKLIYQKRIELYNHNQEVFTPEALEYLVDCAENSPGIFLNFCKKIFRQASPPLSREGINKALDQIVEGYLDPKSELCGYVEAIKSEVLKHENNNPSITVNLPESVSNTRLIFFLITPTMRPGEYEINRLIKDYFESQGKS